MKNLAARTLHFSDSIFGVMGKKALELKAVNLSQGFPDFDGPAWLKSLFKLEIDSTENQYAPFPGTLRLRNSIQSYYQRFYQLHLSADEEITVFNGATEAIYVAIQTIINPGDEVVVFEPFYDSYMTAIKLAGGIPKAVTLKAPDFSWDPEQLVKAITPQTKLVIFNNPHNPTGRLFTRAEREQLSELIIENDCYLLSDEVYEFLVFDGLKHTPMASMPGMQERTITLSSAGKTFGFTGWKVGWALANKELTKAMRMYHQYVTFSVNTPAQNAVALGLDRLESYLPDFHRDYQQKRNHFCSGLSKEGFTYTTPAGTYFVMVEIPDHFQHLNDIEFAHLLIEQYKVASIPPSSFYLNSDEGKKFIRFCFAKKEDTLNRALHQLALMKGQS